MFWEDQTAVLERVAAGHPLAAILEDIVRMIERQAEDMACSILLLDQDGCTIRTGAAPNLPEEYVRMLDGLSIGPNAGSCGAAAHRRERVIVEDIATHPSWADYRHLALPFGLAACWSSPIFSSEREVLGTFAMYYRVPRGPSEEEKRWVDAATHRAAIAIVTDRARRSLRASEARARRLARLYATSNAVNETSVRESDASRLHDAACRITVEHRLARCAWIGRLDAATGRVFPVAQAGEGFERVCPIHLDAAGAGDESDPVARALRTGLPTVVVSLRSGGAPRLREAAAVHGLASCVALPMRVRGAVTGVVVLYADEEGAFGDEETRVLSALADDVAFAVDAARTAAALKQSEERLRNVIEHTPDVAIQWYDEAGKIIFYNEASRRLFGWDERSAMGKTLVELGFWDDAEQARFAESCAQAAAGQHVLPKPYRFVRPDGVEGHLLSTVFRIPLSDAEHCYVCMDVDLTEHRLMEAAVRAGEARRAHIYDCVRDVIFYLAVEGEGRYRFESVNRAFLEATGLREADVVGRLVDDVIPLGSRPLVKAKYAEAIASRDRVAWEEVSRYPSGQKHGEVSVSPVFDRDGRCTHLVGTVHDITARRAAERERREVEAQLHQAQRLQALGTLAGGIAHDFNNILTAIQVNLDVALYRLPEEHAARAPVAGVKEAANRATKLVRQILTFGRGSEPKREPLVLEPVVHEALKLACVVFETGTELRTSVADDVPEILGDATQIHRAVMNVVTNASQALGPTGGVVDVRLDRYEVPKDAIGGRAVDLRPGVYARITIRDDGPGMDAETLRRVFEPFFTTKAPSEGTGLGLSVVHGIVKSHGGAVTVVSEPGKGATFELLFPAAETSSTDRADGEPRSRRVLFVDADEARVVLARRAFGRLGHEVAAHASAAEALRELEARPSGFDVVVADLATPAPDGRPLVASVRRVRPDVRIVAIADPVRPEDVALSKELRIAELLEKPRSIDDLAKLVAERG